ncbi:endonuclease/exonuclease/phosphatase family protein [Sulfitobacter sp. F26169L]|uniref:endonuclease/exonuclease/phosphatase family protein n=1 Tax=Sulfitobacter sp. F26169L TaxID=2996015 RepID=UPI002260CC97|nr:endonuclease/exonuclease/phosphatase family protein [Sulfitobacter sp. F26169L]MCX7567380.1 endonuclease/exonuclease/phosphatase family protein [Sulfitobacter sp. F26169L]
MTELKLASWNIRAGLGRDLRRRPERTIEVISGIDADVFVLQEADFRRQPRPAALPRIHGRIGPYEVIDLTPDAVGLGWHGIAILKRPEITVNAIRRIDLPALEPRGAVIVDLTVKRQPVRIVGVHLGLLRGNRRKQISYITDQLKEMGKQPTIIAGDFNEWRERKGLETLPDWLRTHSPGPTFPAGRPLLKLDKVAMTNDIRLLDSAVLGDFHAQIASDHRPIRARFHLTPRDTKVK